MSDNMIANSGVLVVDDEPLVAEMIAMSIRRWTARVDVVDGVRAAVTFLDHERPPPDVMLLDWRLPDGDPAQVVDVLTRRLAATGVVLITGDRDHGHDVGKRLRVDHVLYKPFRAAELRQALVLGIAACWRRKAGPPTRDAGECTDELEALAEHNLKELVSLFRPHLTCRQFLALRLRLLGLTDEGIAEELGGISPRGAANLYRRALARLVGEGDSYALLRALARLLPRRLDLAHNAAEPGGAGWLSQLVFESADLGSDA